MPEFFARVYSVQFLFSRSRSIFPRTSKFDFSRVIRVPRIQNAPLSAANKLMSQHNYIMTSFVYMTIC